MSTASGGAGVTIERDVECNGDARAIRMANDEVELVATTSYGPRVLVYAPRGRPEANVFGFVSPQEQAKPTSFGEPWHIYGGHRLWHAPEDPVRSYVPDNAPVAARIEDGATVVLTRAKEAATSLVKELRLTLDPHSSAVVVEHRITNAGEEPIDLAVWALSVMARGGQAIFPNAPFVPFPDALLPARRLVLWAYTSLGDPRFRFGPRYLRLTQDPFAKAPQKIGLADHDNGWAAYACGDRLFVKRYAPALPGAKLVDLGCNVETFTDAAILEIETLGEAVRLEPAETAVHVETWQLFCGVTVPSDDDEAARVLAPRLAAPRIDAGLGLDAARRAPVASKDV